jgi:hypothetical protein
MRIAQTAEPVYALLADGSTVEIRRQGPATSMRSRPCTRRCRRTTPTFASSASAGPRPRPRRGGLPGAPARPGGAARAGGPRGGRLRQLRDGPREAGPGRTASRGGPASGPYGRSALRTAAACLKGFMCIRRHWGVNRELGDQLARTRLPTRADRRRALLGHLGRELPANPLAPQAARRRHPKMLPEGARDKLLGVASTARDRLVITWLSDGGFRVGELYGLHFADLHLREDAGCGECRAPHVHVGHRAGNPNRAAAKAGPGMVSSGRHGLRRAGQACLPGYGAHLLRLPDQRVSAARPGHSGGNLLIARDAGGWASATIVEEIYAHVGVHDPAFDAALRAVWGE